jgi:hypothetical protein
MLMNTERPNSDEKRYVEVCSERDYDASETTKRMLTCMPPIMPPRIHRENDEVRRAS